VLKERLAFHNDQTMLVDDNVGVLAAARLYGIRYLFFKAKSSSQAPPDSCADFPALMSFYELMAT
jgi:putative hydrolase of the HAD superfamily